eukprot:TRINITY_DN12559_c0_g1_i3.p1 TRINITY_DN12559_c0_g1~~TRINITY_DN12559_c0_g1_i3.p1  ORF type:complete len:748 (-),score=204.43 TRINITY_DN12559_c0_g1_i3:229-2472(-)
MAPSGVIGPILEETVRKMGWAEIHRVMGSDGLHDFPKRPSGAPVLLRQSFFERLFNESFDLGTFPLADVVAAQTDVRSLSFVQLLHIRCANIEVGNTSILPNMTAQVDFLNATESALEVRVAERLGLGALSDKSNEFTRAVCMIYGANKHLEGAKTDFWLLRSCGVEGLLHLPTCELRPMAAEPTCVYKNLSRSSAAVQRSKKQLHWEVEISENPADHKDELPSPSRERKPGTRPSLRLEHSKSMGADGTQDIAVCRCGFARAEMTRLTDLHHRELEACDSTHQRELLAERTKHKEEISELLSKIENMSSSKSSHTGKKNNNALELQREVHKKETDAMLARQTKNHEEEMKALEARLNKAAEDAEERHKTLMAMSIEEAVLAERAKNAAELKATKDTVDARIAEGVKKAEEAAAAASASKLQALREAHEAELNKVKQAAAKEMEAEKRRHAEELRAWVEKRFVKKSVQSINKDDEPPVSAAPAPSPFGNKVATGTVRRMSGQGAAAPAKETPPEWQTARKNRISIGGAAGKDEKEAATAAASPQVAEVSKVSTPAESPMLEPTAEPVSADVPAVMLAKQDDEKAAEEATVGIPEGKADEAVDAHPPKDKMVEDEGGVPQEGVVESPKDAMVEDEGGAPKEGVAESPKDAVVEDEVGAPKEGVAESPKDAVVEDEVGAPKEGVAESPEDAVVEVTASEAPTEDASEAVAATVVEATEKDAAHVAVEEPKDDIEATRNETPTAEEAQKE